MNETKRKKIAFPAAFKSWVDLRSITRVKLASQKLKSRSGIVRAPRLRQVFKILGMEWEGKQHSGIVDARNTGRLAVKMKEFISITRTIGRVEYIFMPLGLIRLYEKMIFNNIKILGLEIVLIYFQVKKNIYFSYEK